MNAKLWALNIFLATVLAAFSYKAYQTWSKPPGPIPTPHKGSAITNPLPKIATFNLQPESVFEDVVRKNLFSDQRRETFVETPSDQEKAPEVKAAKISGKKIVLYGVIIMDDVKKAMIKNPKRQTGEPEYLWVKEGDNIHNLKVKAIQSDRILLTEKGKNLVVLLHDETSPKKRDISPQTSAGRKTLGEKKTEPQKTPQTTHVATKPAPATTKTEASSAEYEMVETPFGRIKRKKR